MLSVNLPFCGSNTCSALPVSTLYNDILPSCEPDMTNLSHGEKATVHRSTGPNAIWFSNWPESALQKHKPESSELLAIIWPSELMATETTPSEWPVNGCRSSSRWSFRSHILTKSSSPPVTMKSFICCVGLLNRESCEASGSSSSSLGFSCVVRPQAHDQTLSVCAVSCLCSNENLSFRGYVGKPEFVFYVLRTIFWFLCQTPSFRFKTTSQIHFNFKFLNNTGNCQLWTFLYAWTTFTMAIPLFCHGLLKTSVYWIEKLKYFLSIQFGHHLNNLM